MRYVVIPSAEPAYLVEGDPDLKTLQKLVGGYVETYPLIAPWGTAVMWLNEDGKRLGLPRNASATVLLVLAPGLAGDHVVGTAVLTGPADEEGEVTDLPEGWAKRF